MKLVDYYKNPNIDLKLKVLFFVLDWQKGHPGQQFFMSYKTIVKNILSC